MGQATDVETVLDEEAGDRLNLGCGPDYREGWLNVDVNPGGRLEVDREIDLFSFPWDLPGDAFDLVLASHLVEHVPHRVEGADRDGFLAFMEEVHRVLRPEGRLVVKAPHWANAVAAFSDPTHTRVITPETWSYFAEDRQESYYTEARFELVDREVTAWTADWGPRLGSSRLPLGKHLIVRLPVLRGLLGEPFEVTYVLERR